MIGKTRWHFADVASTQNIAFALAEEGAPHGTVVRAEHQHAGRGRMGRSWDSYAGTALMFSVVLRPECGVDQLGSFSLMVANILATRFASITDTPISVKWPNDVLLNNRKVSGILMQTRLQETLVAVLGIGINVLQTAGQTPPGATSLAQEAGFQDRETLYDQILLDLGRGMDSWSPELSVDTLTQIENRLWLKGRHVALLDADRTIDGTIIGVTRTGELRLQTPDGERVVSSGEILRGPRVVDAG